MINYSHDYETAQWFAGSKIFGDDGVSPLPVYHFTYNDFSEFDRLHGAKFFKRDPEGVDTLGSWFTTNAEARYVSADMGAGIFGRRMDALLSIKNPLYIDDENVEGYPYVDKNCAFDQLVAMMKEAGGATNLRAELKAKGHDGIILQSTRVDLWDQTIIIAFEPDQIRVIANRRLNDMAAAC